MIHRRRLVERITRLIPRKLISIVAPPGYGKTTLLADLAANTKLRVCWVRLTEADYDVMRLAGVLSASLKRRFPECKPALKVESLVGLNPVELGGAIAGVILRNVSVDFVVVFDDVHLLNESEEAISLLDAFVERAPPNVTIILAARDLPGFALQHWLAGGVEGGLSRRDLAFDRQEMTAVCDLWSWPQRDEAGIDALLTRSHGWPTAVRLLANDVGAGSAEVTLQSNELGDYLDKVLFERQSSGLRTFLMESALLPRMTADGCDEILMRADSRRHLARLVKEGLFISMAGQSPRTYEYHPLVRTHLISSLEKVSKRRARRLRLRAAEYLARTGLPEAAVDLYLVAGSNGRAAKLVEKTAPGLARRGRVQTLERWAEALEGCGLRIPRLFDSLSEAYLTTRDLDSARDAIEKAQATSSETTPWSLRANLELSLCHLHLYNGNYALLIGGLGRAEAMIKRARASSLRPGFLRLKALAAYWAEKEPARAERMMKDAIALLDGGSDPYRVANYLVDLSVIQGAQGKEANAIRNTIKAHEYFKKVGQPVMLAVSHNNIAVARHIAGDLEQSLQLYDKALGLLRDTDAPAREANILIGLADLYTDLGMFSHGAASYAEGLAKAEKAGSFALWEAGSLHLAILFRKQARIEDARRVLQRVQTIVAEKGRPASAGFLIQSAALEIHFDPNAARSQLEAVLMTDRRTEVDAGEHTLALYYLASCAHKGGDVRAAYARLEEALTWAESHAGVQFVAGELAHDPTLRRFAEDRLAGNAVLLVVLERIRQAQATARRVNTAGEREREGLVQLSALGCVSVSSRDEEVGGLTRQAHEVLFYLADHQRADREGLMETFWPGRSPERQSASLYNTIRDIRATLGRDMILQGGFGYSLNWCLIEVYDVARFEQDTSLALHRPRGDPGRLNALKDAIAAYAGAFLPGVQSSWALTRRDHLQDQFLDLLYQHAQEAVVNALPTTALKSLRRALALAPLRDDLNLALLEVFLVMGRFEDLRETYRRYCKLMLEDLGIDPAPQIKAKYLAAMEQMGYPVPRSEA